jgi:hypothetical protein
MEAYRDAMKKKMQGFKEPKKEDELSMDMAPPREGGLLGEEQELEPEVMPEVEQQPELSGDELMQIRELLQALSEKSHPQRDAMSLGGSIADKAKQDLVKLK